MPKLYTKTGDKGTTSLYDMSRVSKTNEIFEVLGDLDELSAHIGLVLCGKNELIDSIVLQKIQQNLLNIGSDIATIKKREKIKEIEDDDIAGIEYMIDFYDSKCPPLKEFIIAGVNREESLIHICRTICRRAERHLWKVKDNIKTGDTTFIYLNRLSDFFFAYARFLSQGVDIKRQN
jgi:cob(I)alamin adenosyltransferase